MLDADESALRAVGYGLQGQQTFILEASDVDNQATLLVYVSGAYETGGGGSYEKEIVYACGTVKLDLTTRSIASAQGDNCTDAIYAVLGPAGEIDFSEIATNDDARIG